MAKQNDLSRCLVTFEQDATVIAVIEIGQSSWLVAGIVPGLERNPLKKLSPDQDVLLQLLHRWQKEPDVGLWSLRRGLEWARFLGASPPMRMTASWLRSSRVGRIQVRGAQSARTMASSPSGIVSVANGAGMRRASRKSAAVLAAVQGQVAPRWPSATLDRRCAQQPSEKQVGTRRCRSPAEQGDGP
jgi:hypothetical protein